jgi:hypothetical protein
MIGRLLGKEEVNAALVVALSGAVMALVAKGNGRLSLGQVVSAVLSNPVPGGAAGTRRSSSAPAPRQRLAA